METFKKLLRVYSPKERQHFLYLLKRAEECEMSLITARTQTEKFVREDRLRLRSIDRGVDTAKSIPRDKCNVCGSSLIRYVMPDPVTHETITIDKCKKCASSFIVEA